MISACVRALGAIGVLALFGCGGGSGGEREAPQPTQKVFAVGGTVADLLGTGLVLQNNGATDLPISGNGSFAFPSIQDGNAYNVTVKTHPAGPTQTCVVSNGTGTIAGSNVPNLQVTCTTAAFSVGGSVSGLSGTGLALRLNDGPDLAITQNGAFTLSGSLTSGSSYTATISASPSSPAQICSIANAAGSVSDAPITNLQVTCSSTAFSIGGTVAGLAGSGLVLRSNGSDPLPIGANGAFVFPTKIPTGGTYNVTIASQPTSPVQSCSIAAGTGTVTNADVGSLVITCAGAFSVGGSVTGAVSSGLVLRLNGTSDLWMGTDGAFVFPTSLLANSAYTVSVQSEPAGLDCNVTNASGTVSANVTNVAVQCAFPATLSYRVKQLSFSWGGVTGATEYRLLHDPVGSSSFTVLQNLPATARATTVDVSVYRHSWAQARYRVQVCINATCMDSNELTTQGGMLQAIGYFKASNPWLHTQFSVLALSGDGDTLAVGAIGDSSAAIGIDSNQADMSAPSSGAVYVFRRGAAGWAQEAYVKASNTSLGDSFGGSAVALSFDGTTLAVGAIFEDGASTGIDGNQNIGGKAASGAVYVFTRNNSTWSQQAYVKGSNTDAGDFFGASISLSADGNAMAVGSYREASNATGVNGNQTDNSVPDAGAVYVFTRTAGTWSQQAYVKPLVTFGNMRFGWQLALSRDASTLAVGAPLESGGSTGVNGNPSDQSAAASGAAYVFVRSGNSWAQQAYLKASPRVSGSEVTSGGGMRDSSDDLFGMSVALSADGTVLAVGVPHEDSSAIGVDGSNSDNDVSNSGAVFLFRRSSGAWSQQNYFKAPNAEVDDNYGWHVALNAAGDALAVSSHNEDGSDLGVSTRLTDNNASNAGAVYVYGFSGAAWQQPSYIKAPNTDSGDAFGLNVGLSDDGNTLVVGAPDEDSLATGVNGDRSDNRSSGVGAVYMY